LEQRITFALRLARFSDGSSMEARIAMIAMTTSNSMRVKQRERDLDLLGSFMTCLFHMPALDGLVSFLSPEEKEQCEIEGVASDHAGIGCFFKKSWDRLRR
tara:strand:- start:8402 stop:8704 length:303 start_codon:yes stop_codon:yes gene_type:complete